MCRFLSEREHSGSRSAKIARLPQRMAQLHSTGKTLSGKGNGKSFPSFSERERQTFHNFSTGVEKGVEKNFGICLKDWENFFQTENRLEKPFRRTFEVRRKWSVPSSRGSLPRSREWQQDRDRSRKRQPIRQFLLQILRWLSWFFLSFLRSQAFLKKSLAKNFPSWR